MPLFFLSSLHVYHGMCIPVLPQRQDLRGIRGRIKLHGKPICNSKIIKYIENREEIFKESEVFSWMYQIQVSSYSFLFWIIWTWERQQEAGLSRSIHFPSVSTGVWPNHYSTIAVSVWYQQSLLVSFCFVCFLKNSRFLIFPISYWFLYNLFYVLTYKMAYHTYVSAQRPEEIIGSLGVWVIGDCEW